ncbi:bifunctional protein-serine/threonine kinase/phosphatase [Alkalimarinus alittae]|uniref:non-specific serine/threonine protein kinase n=1 Tax=Alkalimarinus alittae TaxID=2961619 RepID=A0ABY6MXJ5_9ALTE|nr:bifunctional protein-serine/threonine kinase/phosphatase [Alkalimarinus alittae]UZE94559.1 bifunctional protein-serine/threonine kinase/phosphatase [Alkalimarinus alittae]
MAQALAVSVGNATDKGVKAINQDYMGSVVPAEPLLSSKGIALAMADGISSSKVSQEASQAAVSGFLEDYYCTSDSWSVKTSVQKVVKSINAWLYAQTRNSPYRFERDTGYICTFSALVLKSNTAHIFHSGDTRIYRLCGGQLEQLTDDHRRVVSDEVSYLTRALGIDQALEIDYKSVLLEKGDTFILATDGVYEFINGQQISDAIADTETLDLAALSVVQQALASGSDDNLSIQLLRVDQVADYQLDEVQQLTMLPLPPTLVPRMEFDGYEIIREIYISSRSHVVLAKDLETNQTVVIKTPSTELRNNAQYLERFMLEEWIAKRVNNPHVAKAISSNRKRNYLYLVSEYIEGISLNQWMIDNPKPSLEEVRTIIEQVAKGLQAFHRQEMIHQDLRPNNIMIDHTHTVKIIDFGSTYISGVTDPKSEEDMRGTMRYSAPEYFLGQLGTPRSDIYALAVITYQMLSGRFPYSTKIAQAKSVNAQRRLNYKSLIDDNSELPLWVDDALRNALQVNPLKRYSELSEFVYDLRHPNKRFLSKNRVPLIERNPIVFWQSISIILMAIIIAQLIALN